MPTSRSAAERLLCAWLRAGGVVCASAIVAVVMPLDWHAYTHRALGLGSFPEAPIAEYLARGMSAMCAFYGFLLLVMASDVRSYRRLIIAQAVILMAIATASTIVLHQSPMPLWWVYGDFIAVLGFCLVLLVLVQRSRSPVS